MRQEHGNLSATLRYIGIVLGMVLVFGGGTALLLAVFDKTQTAGTAPLSNLGAMLAYDAHFIAQLLSVLITGQDVAGVPYRNYFLTGLAVTLVFCFISLPVALLFGLILAVMSRSHRRVLRVPARAFVEFFRNTPLLVQLLAIYSGLLFLPSWFLNAYSAGIATLVLNYAAYECENLRAGIAAIDRGQTEAALSLGLDAFQTYRMIVLPQMIRIVLPPVINDLIYMYKDSSILSVTVIVELTATTQGLARHNPSLSWEMYAIGAAFYLVLSLPLAHVARSVEARLRAVGVFPRFDLTSTAAWVLCGMVAIGWICTRLVAHFSPGSLGTSSPSLLYALVLTTGLIVSAVVVLGAATYLPASLVAALRQAVGRWRKPQSSTTTAITANVTAEQE